MKKDKRKNKETSSNKKWWKYLFGVFSWILIACLIFLLAIIGDYALPGGSDDVIGHKAPVFTMFAFPIAGILLAIGLIRAIVKIVRSIKYFNAPDEHLNQVDDSVPDIQELRQRIEASKVGGRDE